MPDGQCQNDDDCVEGESVVAGNGEGRSLAFFLFCLLSFMG